MEVDPVRNPDLAVSLRYMMRAGFHYEVWPALQDILLKTDFLNYLRSLTLTFSFSFETEMLTFP